MPSPFPGMDPYLESSDHWRDVHHRLISGIADELNRLLPERYVARIDERLYLVETGRPIYPDVFVRSQERPRPHQGSDAGRGNGVTTLAPPEAPWQVVAPEPLEIAEAFIEVQSLRPERRAVAVIEVLSPSNKAAGSVGRTSYQQKQRELSEQGIALLEIDLLRDGEHTVGAELELLQDFGTWDYLACLHRAEAGRRWEVWPIRLREPLPEVRVPLLGEDQDVPIALQPILDQAYDRGVYARELDYRREPDPPLNAEDAAWARELLRLRVEGPGAAEENGSAP